MKQIKVWVLRLPATGEFFGKLYDAPILFATRRQAMERALHGFTSYRPVKAILTIQEPKS